MRNALLDLTTILPATAYHRRSYAERYSRFIKVTRKEGLCTHQSPITLAVSGEVSWCSFSLRSHLTTARGISQAVHRAVTGMQLARVLLYALGEGRRGAVSD